MKFLFLPLDRYLFRVASDKRYLPRGSKENVLSISVIGYVTVCRWVSPVVTIPFLDFVTIDRINRCLFRENSIVVLSFSYASTQ